MTKESIGFRAVRAT